MENYLQTKNEMMGIIIFDLDGTLVDSMPAQAKAYSKILQIFYSIPEQESQRDYFSTAGQPLDRQFEHTISLYNLEISNIDSGHLTNKFWEILADSNFELFPCAYNIVTNFKNAGYLLAISSGSSPSVAVAKLQKARIFEYFTIVLGSDYEKGILIKGPDHLDFIKLKLGVSDSFLKENALYIGDGIHDMEIAKNANLKSIGIINNGNENELIKAGASYLISDLAELLSLLVMSDSREYIPISQLKFGKS
jgi:phosphoglycolate phosphatase-like HAD superfamily hydrolase